MSFEKKCKELQAAIDVLQSENELLSERAEESFLISMIADSIGNINDKKILMENILERISILKNIPYCACCELKQNTALQICVYSAFSNVDYSGTKIKLFSQVIEDLNDGVCLISGELSKKKNMAIDFKGADFVPASALIFPFTTKSIPNGIFIFIDDDNDENKFKNISVLLQNIINMVVERLGKISLIDELKKLNNELDHKVKERTILLVETNKELNKEISERKKAEEELRQSEERLDLAMFGANDGIWDWRPDNNTILFDSRYYTMAGYEPNEFPCKFDEWEKRVHPDDIRQANIAIEQYLAGDRETFEVEFRFLRKDGDYMWIRGKGKIVARDEKGNPARFIGTHSDITERKRAEEKLRKSETRFRTTVESSPMGMHFYELKDDGRLIFSDANPAADRLLGVDNSIFIGKTIEEAFPPLINTEVPDRYRQAAVKAQSWNTEQIQYEEGSIKGAFEVVAFQTEQNKMVALFNNITERKQAEEELHRLRNYLSNIIDSMPSVLVGINAKCKVTLWNKKAEQTTGIITGDALGKALSDVFPRMASEKEKITESIRSRETKREQKWPRQSKSGTCYEDVTIYPLIANGVEGAVIRIDDVTDKVRMEEMMIQSEKMLSVGGLAAGMAHEINNPLAGIMQTADVISNRLTNLEIPANQRAAEAAGTTMDAIHAFMEARDIITMLNRIRESGGRAAEIVTNMLSFARKSDSTFSSCDLAKLLDQTADMAGSDYDLKKKFDFRQIEIVHEYEENLPLVPCEASKIQQVLFNLLRNGAEAMQEGDDEDGMMKDESCKPRFIIRLAYEKERGMVRVEIEDNGPGIPDEIRRRIFEPFFTTKGEGVGTGLGLSVSYFIIVENHGGEMNVESTPGKGAKFIIKLPIERKKS